MMGLKVIILFITVFAALVNSESQKSPHNGEVFEQLGTILGTNWSKVLLKMLPNKPVLKKDSVLKGLAKIGSIIYPKFMQTVKYSVSNFVSLNGNLEGAVEKYLKKYPIPVSVKDWVLETVAWFSGMVSYNVNGISKKKLLDKRSVHQTLQESFKRLKSHFEQ